MSDELIQHVEWALASSGVDQAQIELEITESAALENFDQVLQKLHILKQMGMRLALDDFGTGYSSLSYLHRLPLDILKVDRAFVKGIGTEDSGAIARAVIAMAHGMGLQTIVEGVETPVQHDFVRENGGDVIQGFYYSSPLTAQDLEIFVRNRNQGTPPGVGQILPFA